MKKTLLLLSLIFLSAVVKGAEQEGIQAEPDEFNVGRFRKKIKLSGHTESVNDVSWSPDSSKFASASDDGTIKIWNQDSREPLQTLPTPKKDNTWGDTIRSLLASNEPIRSISWSPDSSKPEIVSIFSQDKEGVTIIWDPIVGDRRKTLIFHNPLIITTSWSPDGSKVAYGIGAAVEIWNPTTGKRFRISNERWGNKVYSLSWSPDSSKLASGSFDEKLRIWDTLSAEYDKVLFTESSSFFSGNPHFNVVSWSPDGSKIASGLTDGRIEIWNPNTSECLQTLILQQSKINTISWSPGSSQFASGSKNGKINIWIKHKVKDLQTFLCLQTLSSNRGSVNSVSWSPDGSKIVSGSSDKTVIIWERIGELESPEIEGSIEDKRDQDRKEEIHSESPTSNAQVQSHISVPTERLRAIHALAQGLQGEANATRDELTGYQQEARRELKQAHELVDQHMPSVEQTVSSPQTELTGPALTRTTRTVAQSASSLRETVSQTREELVSYQQQSDEELDAAKTLVVQRITAAFTAHKQQRKLSQERNATELQEVERLLQEAQGEVRRLKEQSDKATQDELKETQQKLEEAKKEVARLEARHEGIQLAAQLQANREGSSSPSVNIQVIPSYSDRRKFSDNSGQDHSQHGGQRSISGVSGDVKGDNKPNKSTNCCVSCLSFLCCLKCGNESCQEWSHPCNDITCKMCCNASVTK